MSFLKKSGTPLFVWATCEQIYLINRKWKHQLFLLCDYGGMTLHNGGTMARLLPTGEFGLLLNR